MRRADRRTFLAGCVAGCAAAFASLVHPRARGATAAAAPELVYAGTQDRRLYALRFDPDNGALAAIGIVAEGPRTTWTVVHPRLPILYAVDDDSTRAGRIIAYAVDRASGALRTIGETPSGGKGTTYLSLDADATTLFAAHFGSGSVSSLALDADGVPGAPVSTIVETGGGPHRRQASAHAHAAVVDPSGRFVLVPDLGADRVFVYGVDHATHCLTPDDAAPSRALALAPGSGPRHLAFGADGRFAYLVNELAAQVVTLRWDAPAGRLAVVQTLALDDAGFTGTPSGAEVVVSAGGRMVYVANRGASTLQAYRVDAATGSLTPVQRIASGGEGPWHIALHRSGRWLLAANQRGGSVDVFRVDGAGMLAHIGHAVALATPVSLSFVR